MDIPEEFYCKRPESPKQHGPWEGPEDTICQSEEDDVGEKGTSIRQKFSGGCHLFSEPASESGSISHTRSHGRISALSEAESSKGHCSRFKPR